MRHKHRIVRRIAHAMTALTGACLLFTATGCESQPTAGGTARPLQAQQERIPEDGVPISISYGHVQEGGTYWGFVIVHGQPATDMEIDLEVEGEGQGPGRATIFPKRITVEGSEFATPGELQFHVFRVDTSEDERDYTIKADVVGGTQSATATLIVSNDDGIDENLEE